MPTMTNADRRRGRMNTRWFFFFAVIILGILSQIAVAQMDDDMPDNQDPDNQVPTTAPTEAPAPDAANPTDPSTETPTTMDAPEDTPPPTDAPEDEDTPPPTDAPNEDTPPPTDAPNEDAPEGEDTQPPTDAPKEDAPPPAPENTPAPTKATEETLEPTKEPNTRPPTAEPVPTEAPTDPTDPISSSPTDAPETSSPTDAPETSSPTTSPTDVPDTESPSASPTLSLAPTDVLAIDIKDDVSVIIKPVSEPMSASNSKHFANTAELFLSEYYIQLEQPIYNVSVVVTGGNILPNGRVRRLQEMPLQVDMQVSGSFYPVPGLAETAEDNYIGSLSRQFFNVQGDKFVQMLKETDNQDDAAYFAAVTSVESVALADDYVEPPADESSSGGPSTATIAIVAVVGALVVSLVAIFIYKKVPRHVPNDRSNRQNGASRQNGDKASRQNGTSARQSDAAKRASQDNGALARPSKAVSKSMADQSPPIKTVGGPSESYIKRVDSDVQSDLQSGWGAESMLGMESNMSYAYSLEDGIKHTRSADSSDHPVPSIIAPLSSTGSEQNDENDDLDIDKDFSPTPSTILREITAPPGKLGLVLNTTDRGPVVQEVASGSPLEGMVWPGDIIISIDDIKTKNMSADQVTQYMTENLFKKRRLTVLSDGRA